MTLRIGTANKKRDCGELREDFYAGVGVDGDTRLPFRSSEPVTVSLWGFRHEPYSRVKGLLAGSNPARQQPNQAIDGGVR